MRLLIHLTALFILFSPAVTSQQTDLLPAPWFPSASYFRWSFTPETPRAQLQPPIRLGDFVVDGKLELSLRAYLELVLANNTDIQIQKLTVEVPKNAITRAFAPFDPTLSSSFRSNRQRTPTQDALAGAATLQQLTQPYQLLVSQTLDTGTQYSVGFRSTRTSTNNTFATFNPAVSANLDFTFTQPLLRGRGYVNKIPIVVARTRYRASQYTVEDQLLRLLEAAENAYWNVIEAREGLKVQDNALGLADQVLKRAQLELKLGSISPLEIYQPQQQYANAEVLLTQARYRLIQTEDQLRRQMGVDLDPDFRTLPLVLTETVLPPADERAMDKERFVESAYQRRPDLKSVLQNIEVDDLQIQQAKNNLLPNLSLSGNYSSFGRGGEFLEGTSSSVGGGPRIITRVTPVGFGDVLDQIFQFNNPTYGLQLTLTLPLRDRRAAADLADATVNKRLDYLRARNLEQQIRQEVLNAVTQVENSRASVKLAEVALDFAQKRVDAEQKRYDLGVTTIFFLIDAQNALTVAQSNLVTQSVQYRRNLLNLLRVTGQLLEERGVRIE